MTRCNYCHRDAVASISWTTSMSRMGQRQSLKVSASTCAEHEGCVNWKANLALHPEAPIMRAKAREAIEAEPQREQRRRDLVREEAVRWGGWRSTRAAARDQAPTSPSARASRRTSGT